MSSAPIPAEVMVRVRYVSLEADSAFLMIDFSAPPFFAEPHPSRACGEWAVSEFNTDRFAFHQHRYGYLASESCCK
jgi:hypothetical protein